MVAIIIISVVVVWVLLSGLVVLAACMSSSQFSQREALLAQHPAGHERNYPEFLPQSEGGRQRHFEPEKAT